MILKRGDMFRDSKADVILFTGNATVRQDGCLVMGRGAALQALKRFPGINRVLGEQIRLSGMFRPGKPYGVCVDPHREEFPVLGVFQVKWHYADDAELGLIEHSAIMLTNLAKTDWNNWDIAVNFPGIGYGRLAREDVLPIIESLPDNVEVWEK